MFENIESSVTKWLIGIGLSNDNSVIVSDFVTFTVLVLLSLITYFITKKILLSAIHHATKKSKTQWDDILSNRKFFRTLSYFVPAYIIYAFTPVVLEPYPDVVSIIRIGLTIYMIMVALMAANAFLNAVSDIYQDFSIAKSRPIKGYIQVIKIIVYMIGIIIILANLFG
ncbi:MAG: hypothetical protein KDC05_15545, partial [Bacteroidales bacterium]|nr:hypothetical protein [Bacteroidales bacterium]